MTAIRLLFGFLLFVCCSTLVSANFEDSRCRCICPNTQYFSSVNHTDNRRRYYTKTNVRSQTCNPQNVVKTSVDGIVEESHIDAFLANCDCRYETRNTVLLKVVVIFVICVLVLLIAYMVFLTLLDPAFKRRRASVNYKRQDDEIEENIFANGTENGAASGSTIPMRATRNAAHLVETVENEASKWQETVEEQRRKVFKEHSVLQ
ncbi:hypothetical protein M3Y99_01726900 [Aphelenchoides fujianensis]|nr:hypothetical protein M3Y99_01726900 [Aphelenchoides fujianensis]